MPTNLARKEEIPQDDRGPLLVSINSDGKIDMLSFQSREEGDDRIFVRKIDAVTITQGTSSVRVQSGEYFYDFILQKQGSFRRFINLLEDHL